MSIFISIASYCDPVLGFTLARAVATARWPDQLHFGVVDQSPAGSPHPVGRATSAPARLSYVRIEPLYARGPCWARALAMSLYDGEDWFFQIDSHMDFDPHWDERLIAQAQALLPGRKGVVLSSYPNSFVFEDKPPVRRPATDKILAHVVKPGGLFEPDHPVLGFEAHPLDRDQPVPGFHVGAGCLFAPGAFRPGLSLRSLVLFSRRRASAGGAPVHPRLGHLSRAGPARLPPVQQRRFRRAAAAHALGPDPRHRSASATGGTLEQRSRARLAALLAGEPLGVYGLGRVRSMADYAGFSGIDYAARTLAPRAFVPLGRLAQPG